MRASVHAAAGRAAHRAGPRRALAHRGAGHRRGRRSLGHARAGLRRVRPPQERREAAGGAGRGGRRRRARGRAVAGVRRRGFHVEGAGRQGGCGGGTPTAHAGHGRRGLARGRAGRRGSCSGPLCGPAAHRGPKGCRRRHRGRPGRERRACGARGRRHRFRQDRGVPAGHRAHARRGAPRHRARAGNLAYPSDRRSFPRPLRRRRGRHALPYERRRALRPVGLHQKRRGQSRRGRTQRAVHARGQRGTHRHRRGARGLLQAGFLAALPRARRGRMDDGPGRRCAGARLGHPFHRVPLPSEQEPALDDGGAARARQRATHARHRGGGHGRRVRLRFPGHVLRTPRPGAGRGARTGPQGGASAEPARLREVPSVSRLRFRARVSALLHLAHLPRAGRQAHLPPLRLHRGRPSRVSGMRQPLPEEVRRRHPAGGNRAAPALGRAAWRGANRSHHPHGRRHHPGQGCASGPSRGIRRRRCRGAARHPDDRQGTRFRRRHAGGRHQRRHPAASARLPRRRAHLPAHRAGGGPRRPRRAGRARHGADLRGRRRGHPRRRHLQPRDVPARRAAQAQAFGLPALRANGQRASVGRRRARRGHRGRAPARPAGRACPQRGGGALAGAAGSALRAGEAAQHLPLPHRGEGAFGRRYLGAAGAPVPHA